jgi:6-phosphogluconolactonase
MRLATRLSVLAVLGLTRVAAGAGEGGGKKEKPLAKSTLVYVGTYTGAKGASPGKGQGIYVFRLQTDNLEVSQNITLVPLGLAAETPNPSYLELDPKRRLVFAVNEISELAGQPTGAVSAFSVEAATGKLTLVNQRPSQGIAPCHLVLDKEGRNLVVANCGSGSVVVFPVGAGGRLGEPSAVIPQTAGPGHTQGVGLDPSNRFAFACDLGLDRVLSYRFDTAQGKLSAGKPAGLKAGAGPRHLAFRPDGRFAYVVNERTSTLTTFSFDGKTGALAEVQTISTLPDYFDGPNSAAEVGIHPGGKYLYVSNRGHNSVVLFGIDADKGTLTYVEEQGTGGVKPRHFGIEPSGKHLAIANQDSDTVLVCRVDAGNGRLKPSGVFASVPSPACVKFLPPAEGGR